MALLTLNAEAPGVHVITGMTGTAHQGGFADVLGLDVAFAATDLGVRSREREARALRVVEVPQLPAVGCVARRALLAQTSLVDVIVRVTAETIVRSLLETLCRMALTAGHHSMQPE